MNTTAPEKEERVPLTVVMRCYNDAPILPRTLTALTSQRGVSLRILVFESASTDGSPEILTRYPELEVEHLAPGSYWSSTVLNRGLSRATSELVAFVNSDAVLVGDRCLRDLADALLAEPRCAGVFARQVPRGDASACTRMDLATAFDWRHELGVHADCLSMVCSMVRRQAWEEQAFDEALTFAEDYVWSRMMQSHGWTIRYVQSAVAEHSHEYTAKQQYRRAFGDAAAMAKVSLAPPASNVVTGVVWPWMRRCLRDAWRLARIGHLGSVWRLPAYRWPKMLGEWHGARAGWRCFHEPGGGNRQPLA